MSEDFDLSSSEDKRLVIHLLTSIDRKIDLTADKVTALSESIAVVTSELKTSKENIEKLEARVSEVEKNQHQTEREISSMMVRITGMATAISTAIGAFLAWLIKVMGATP